MMAFLCYNISPNSYSSQVRLKAVLRHLAMLGSSFHSSLAILTSASLSANLMLSSPGSPHHQAPTEPSRWRPHHHNVPPLPLRALLGIDWPIIIPRNQIFPHNTHTLAEGRKRPVHHAGEPEELRVAVYPGRDDPAFGLGPNACGVSWEMEDGRGKYRQRL